MKLNIPEHSFFERYLTPEMFAELFELNVDTVYRWMQDGKLPAKKLPKTKFILIDLQEVVACMEEYRNKQKKD